MLRARIAGLFWEERSNHRTFCVDVDDPATAVRAVFRNLARDAQGVADLRLAGPPLAVHLCDCLAVKPATKHRVELFG